MKKDQIEEILKRYFKEFMLLRNCGYWFMAFDESMIGVWFSSLEENKEKDYLIFRYEVSNRDWETS